MAHLDEPPSRGARAGEANPAPAEAGAAAERLRTALDLFALGVEMLRSRLRREDPSLSEEGLDQHVNRWLSTRRGAELGDAEGRPGSWPRRPT